MPIVIISPDTLFCEVLAGHIQAELGEACIVVKTPEEVSAISDISAIVSASPTELGNIPVIQLSSPPIRVQEVLQALASIARAMPMILGDCEFQPRQKRLIHRKTATTLDLTDKETQLLQTLLEGKSQGVAKDDLLKTIWKVADDINTHTLETHIYRLRAKLKDISGSEVIEATDGGYRLNL